MAIATARRMTLEEFRALPEGPPYFEFEEGELIPMGSPTLEHQDIVDELVQMLRRFVRDHRMGRVFREVDTFLPDGRVYIPDIGFVTRDRIEELVGPIDRKIHGVPDLVIEVTSTNPERDRVHKFRIYYENSVPWYWIVDGETLAIEEYRATPEGYVRAASVAAGEEFQPALFPGLTIDLAALLGIEVSAETSE
jgi:Uma2 family endonuclease